MATLNITRDVPIPNAVGVYVDTDNLAPRHRSGDLLCLGLTPARIGDEVACETIDGLVVGELIEVHGSNLVLAQCCRLPTGDRFTVEASRHWPIVGRWFK
jgi:hypothetical protein